MKNFLSTLKNVQKVEILPYHTMGKYKWNEIGVDYELEGVRDANDQDIERAKKLIDFKN